MTIIGREHIQFKSRTTGDTISGWNIYATSPIDPAKGVGDLAEKLFMSDEKFAQLGFEMKPGTEVEFFFNRFGKVATAKLISESEIDFE